MAHTHTYTRHMAIYAHHVPKNFPPSQSNGVTACTRNAGLGSQRAARSLNHENRLKDSNSHTNARMSGKCTTQVPTLVEDVLVLGPNSTPLAHQHPVPPTPHHSSLLQQELDRRASSCLLNTHTLLTWNWLTAAAHCCADIHTHTPVPHARTQ